MNKSDFIQHANAFGCTRQPCFFAIDFEQQRPFVCALPDAEKCGFYYAFGEQTNFKRTLSPQPLQLRATPVPLEDYARAFNQVAHALQAGNTYLLNLTMPTPIACNLSLEAIFALSRAPYKLLSQGKNRTFVCFSPEPFVQSRDNQIFSYPMKGTIDATLPDAEQRLLNNQKELWEHNTIVDLIRNDLAMVAEHIQVTRFRYVERLETERGAILQTSSEIRGNLPPNWQSYLGEMLWTLLPAGSISGAPKEKTVEIIQQAEGAPRGFYTGIFGIFDGENVQSAVAIRFIEQGENGLIFRSGGGITAQSQLRDEYLEVAQKVYIPIRGDDV
ncbi:aminodeoxychorismate synthase component I [Pasteurellaceae bacterium HPA106]|uniref:aminodeoxychorismate synthase component I n=1 Tax=Spirabiliibacterium pneumoniae TaxID=221400 RepID=UPI001AADB114|nr:aminodeoxychorismate synthase component I [Spirabiliibacterium pneumoniae]MBE2896013.1 aminodeoxychorismate synthase component I [Spirabiliibacterium pneumoniae]